MFPPERPIKVAHLTSAHPPNDVRIFLKECKTLAGAGFEVTLVAAKGGEISGRNIQLRKVRSPRSRLERFTLTWFEVLREALRVDADIYHFHEPDLIPAGMALKLCGKKVIFDAHEDYSHVAWERPWIPDPVRPFFSRMTRLLENASGRMFDGIVAATPAIGRQYPNNKTAVVQNFPVLGELTLDDSVPYLNRAPHFIYVGAISWARGLKEMVSAFAEPAAGADARLLLLGGPSEANVIEQAQQQKGWSKVDYRGEQPRLKVAQALSEARAGLALLHPLPNHIESQPIKFFEYLSVGLPLIVSNFPLWKKFVETHRVGLAVDPNDPRAIAEAMRWILDNPEEAKAMGERGKLLVETQFNWEPESQQLLSLYRRLSHGLRGEA